MTPPADEQPLSRRQLRELQKAGGAPTRPSTPQSTEPAAVKPAPNDEIIETAEIVAPDVDAVGRTDAVERAEPVVPVIPADGRPMTRRQARELERTRTAAITVITADQGAPSNESGEIVTAETIDEPTGEHAPVGEPDMELVEKSDVFETGDLTEAVIESSDDDEPAAAASDAEPVGDTVVAERFGEAPLVADGDPLADEKPFDAIIATGAADAEPAATTSSTLILGSPMTTFTGPIGGTGEIMVTGSIDLPRTLSGTGDADNADRADYDRSLDHEPPAPPTAGTPVSASKAVSTHTSARDVIPPPASSKKPNILMVLAITAGALMVAVIAVVVAGLVSGAF